MCFYQIPYEHPHHTSKARNPLKWLGLWAFFMFCAFVYCPPTSPNLRNYNEDIESEFSVYRSFRH